MNETVIYDYGREKETTENGQLLGSVHFKPMNTMIIIAVIGVVAVLWHNLFGILFGCFCLIMDGTIYCKVRDHRVMDVYDDAIVIFDRNDENKGIRIPVEKIKQWEVNRNQNYGITLILEDGSIFSSMSYEASKAQKLLQKVLKGKSTEEIQIARNRREKRKWRLL